MTRVHRSVAQASSWVRSAFYGGVVSLACVWSGSAGAVEIAYPSYHWAEPTYGAFLKGLKAEFEKENPGVQVKDAFVPFAAFNDQMYIDITSGNPPDVLTALDPDFKRYVDKDLLEPLDPYLAAAGVKLEDFIPAARLAMKNGKVYGIVFASNPRVMFYNKSLYEKAGIGIPKNLAEFEISLKALRDPTKQQFAFATAASSGAPDQQYLEYAPMFASFGAKVFTAGKPSANTPTMVKALTFYKSMVDQSLIPKGVRFEVYRPMFVNGRVGSYVAGPFMGAVTAAGNKQTYAELVTAALPFGDGPAITVTNYIGVPKNAKQKDLAAKLIVSMLKPENQRKIVDTVNVIPAIKGMVTPEFISRNPWFKAIADISGGAVSYAPEGAEQYGAEIVKIVGNRVEAMLFRGVSPQETADGMQADLVKFMTDKT